METRDFLSDLLSIDRDITDYYCVWSIAKKRRRRVQRVRVILIVPGRICIVT